MPGGQLEEMGPRDGGVVGEGAEEPGRSERALIASGGGMRRSEEARVSEEEGWRRRSQEIGNGLRMERPRSPCEVRKSLRQVGRAQGEVRKPKCQRKED
jgi:hypothetical protein